MTTVNEVKTYCRIAFVACGLQACVASAATSFKGGDLGNPDDWTAGLPDENTALTFYGATTATNASQDIVAKSLELAHSNARTVWNLGSHKLTAGAYAFGSGNGIHDVGFLLTGGSLIATTYNAVYIGGNGACSNTVALDNATLDLSSEGRVTVGQGSGADNNTFVVGTNATLLIGLRKMDVGENGSRNTAAFIGSKKVQVAGNVTIGSSATACNNRLVMRDVESAEIGGDVYLGYADGAVGNTLLVSNVTSLALGGTIHVGYAGACSTGEIHLAEGSTTLPTIKVGETATAINSHCLVDGAGASLSASFLTTYANIKAAGSSIELRNLTLTTSDTLALIDPNLHWVFGPGATFASTYTGYSPLPLYGANSGMTIDGGALSFPNSNGSIWLGSRTYGTGAFFAVKDGGIANLHNNFQIATEKCRVDVLSGSTLTANGFYCNASDATVTISNATMDVENVSFPTHSGDYADWATNNVIRFVGTSPSLKAKYLRVWNNKIGNEYTSAPIFDFVIPEKGYATVPVDVSDTIWFRETPRPRLRIDASAYTGGREWMTLMRAANTISVANFDAFISEIPENCRVRNVTVDGHKEIQLQVRLPRGLLMIVR